VWDDEQHRRLLDGAIRTLNAIPNNSEWSALFPLARRMVALISVRSNGDYCGPFYDGMRRGLHDADYKDEFTGTYLGRQIYYMHFYDSDTGHSFVRGRENARTECNKYFEYSLFTDPDTANDNFRDALGFLLGLSLHYLTDITQPMHAVNFTNYLDYRIFDWRNAPNWDDKRHSAFEKYADSDRFIRRPEQYTVAQLDPARWGGAGGAGSILHEVSVCSRKLYDSGLRQLVDSTPPAGSFGAAADRYIVRSLDHGFYHTAMFLLYWAQRAPRTQRP
jgi:hypothetical protein